MFSRKLKNTVICTIVLLALGAVTTTAFAAGTMIPHTRTYAWEIAPTTTGLVFAPQTYSDPISSNTGDKWQLTFTITGGTFNAGTPFTDASLGGDSILTPNCLVKPVSATQADYTVALRSQTSTSVTFDVTALGTNPNNLAGVPNPCGFRLNGNGAVKFNFNSTVVGSTVQIMATLVDEFNAQLPPVDQTGNVDLALVGEAATMVLPTYATTIDAINYDDFNVTPLALSRFVQGVTPAYYCGSGSYLTPSFGGGLNANYPDLNNGLFSALGYVPSTSGPNDCPLIARASITTGNRYPHVYGTDGVTEYILAGPTNPDVVMFTLNSAITSNWDDVLSICLDLNNDGIGTSSTSPATNECFTTTPGSANASLTVNGNRLGPNFGGRNPVWLMITAGKDSSGNDKEIQGRTITMTAQIQRFVTSATDPNIRTFGPNSLVEYEGSSVAAGAANPAPFWTFMYNGTKLITNLAAFDTDLTGGTGIVYKLRFTNLSGSAVKIIVMPNSVVPDPASGVPISAITVNALPSNTQTGGYVIPPHSSIQVPFNTPVGAGETAPTFATITPTAGVRTTVTVIAATTLNNILGQVLMPSLNPTLNTFSLYPMSATDGIDSTLFTRFQ